MPKTFPLDQILTLTTGRCVCEDPMEAVRALCSYLTGESLYGHQVLRATQVCQSHVLKQYPQLLQIELSGLNEMLDSVCEGLTNEDACVAWVKLQEETLGIEFSLEPLPEGVWLYIDPVEELGAIIGDEQVMVMEVGEDGSSFRPQKA